MRAINGRLTVGAFLVCAMSWAIPAESALLTVDPQGNGFRTIQEALDAAVSSDIVQLVDGTYSGEGNVSLFFHRRTITLCSLNGPAHCIVDCGNLAFTGGDIRGAVKGLTILNSGQMVLSVDDLTFEECVFQGSVRPTESLLRLGQCRPTLLNCAFRNFSGADGAVIACHVRCAPIIRGCTFENNSSSLDAGAILNLAGSSPVITECRFVNNSCQDDGGAIANYEQSHPIIVACTFERNQSNDNGGAIFSRSGSSPRIVSCLFADNRARGHGGAIYNRENAAAIVNCVFTGNSAHNYGGALYCTQTDELATLLNCTLVGNSAGLEGGAVYCDDRDGPSLLNCILWANRDETGDSETSQIFATAPILRHCCVQNWTGQWADTANHGLNPQFVDADGLDDVAGTADDNFRLLPGSPCIDAGFDAPLSEPFRTDCDGYPRRMGTFVDLGAYEYALPEERATLTPTQPQLEEQVIVINEARTRSPEGPKDWVELHNLTDRDVHLDGWLLSDEVNAGVYELAAGTVIEPHGYLVLHEDQHFRNQADPGCHIPFALNWEGDILHLRSGHGGLPTGLWQEQVLENFTRIGASDTLGRYTTSDGATDFVRLSVPTPGAANAHPWVGPVVVSEILYSRDSRGRILAYVELYNSSNASAQVSILVGDVADPLFTQDPVTVPAQSRVLLTDRPDLVQATYGSIIPPGIEILDGDARVTWFGYDFGLSLRQGFVTYDTVACRYGWLGFDSWPANADGEALSVTRVDPTRYGNDPNNWQAAPPSPGG
jgi:predicted outer membrane repeat protein